MIILQQEPLKGPSSNYSDVVIDTDKAYPFRGFVHCMVGELEKTHGEKAVADLVN